MSNQTPTVGRIVHYQSHGSPNGQHKSEPRAAVVTAVRDVPVIEDPGVTAVEVDLCVLNPTGLFFNQRVPFSPEPQAGCWSWPPRA